MKKVLMGVLAACVVSGLAFAAERPGTPLSAMKTQPAISQDQLVKVVQDYIAEQSKDKGAFAIKDDRADKDMHLTLDKVDKDQISVLGENKYLVPASFKDASGKQAHVEFILKPGLTGSDVKVSDKYLHKVDGVERYQWMKKGDDWERQKTTDTTKTM